MGERKELGKIGSIYVGEGGYQDVMFGVIIRLEGDGWGVGDFKGTWGPGIKVTQSTEWTEESRVKKLGETILWLAELCVQAKKTTADKLKGVPVEVTFEDNTLKSWRILTEVL